MGSASSSPSRSPRIMAEPTEARTFLGRFLTKFSSACCFIMLTIAIIRERDKGLDDLLLLGGIRLFKRWFAYFVVCAFLAFHVRCVAERIIKHVAE